MYDNNNTKSRKGEMQVYYCQIIILYTKWYNYTIHEVAIEYIITVIY